MRACLLQKSIGFPQLHTGGSVLTFGCWEPNPGPKKDFQVLVTTQPPLQALSLDMCVCISTHSREGQKTTCESQMPSPQDLQVLRIQPRSSGLVIATIRHWATSPDLTMYLYLFIYILLYIAQIPDTGWGYLKEVYATILRNVSKFNPIDLFVWKQGLDM